MSSRRSGGFTLVEVLVALSILVIALGVLLKIIAISLDRTREVRDETVASSLLQSLLVQAGTSVPLTQGDSGGVFANGFIWHLHVEPYGSDNDRQAWSENAMTVVATVAWRDDGRVQSRSLTTLRIAPVETP
jgi:general secretion pathway protein I